MEKKVLKKLLAILMIIMIMSTDFLILGSNLISYGYATESGTNNDNIEFWAYFKDESGNKINPISESIKTDNIKVYAQIAVKNEGYFNGSIELKDSNFRIKNEILTTAISSIEGNKVNLNQINAGETVEIELNIEPISADVITTDMLSKKSTFKLTGTYKETKQGILSTTVTDTPIEAEKTVTANFVPTEETNAELETDIITNKVFSVNGKNKRIVQMLVNSKLTENIYPIKTTTISIDIPQLSDTAPEEIKVLSLGTKATNGMEDYIIDNFTNEDGKLKITINNEPNENGEIKWLKNACDEIVITFIYDEEVDATELEIKAESEISVYNVENKYTASYVKGISNQELNGIITTKITTDSTDLYKGQLYANTSTENKKEIEYDTKTTLQVTNTDVSDKVIIHEGTDKFLSKVETKENEPEKLEEINVNTKFLNTTINKDKMLNILGENGQLQIKTGLSTYNITKDTEADENGNIVIDYGNIELQELEIVMTKPEKAGILEIKHKKAIMNNMDYTLEQLQTIKGLKVNNAIIAVLGDTEVIKNLANTNVELKEPITKAELVINKNTLSTMTMNENVILGIKLITDNSKYDLYKNPKIKIQLPDCVEEISVNDSDKLYAEGFEITKAIYNKVDKAIEIELAGEQTEYPQGEATQIYLQLDLNIKLSKLTPNKKDNIIMTYVNEKATKYEEESAEQGTEIQEIEILSPSGMITVNNVESHNIQAISGIDPDKQMVNLNKNTDKGTKATYRIGLINNTGAEATGVKIVGNLPTTGEITIGNEKVTNTLATELNGLINANNATVYYSENINATENLEDANNGWTTNIREIGTAKSYLIEIPSIPAETNFEATYTMNIPKALDYGMTSYEGYKVIYGEEKIEALSTGLTTGEGIKLETTIEGTVGNNELNNGDTVKNGEVIKYKATVKNNGTNQINNIVLKAGVPTGTVVVEPEEDFVYTGPSYYEEKTEVKEIAKEIQELKVGEEYSFEYEVRVNNNTGSGTQISNKAIATSGEYSLESAELTNVDEEAKLRVTIKRIRDLETELRPGSVMEYQMFVENLTDTDISNVQMEVQVENQLIKQIDLIETTLTTVVKNSNIFTIEKIPARGLLNYSIVTEVSGEPGTEIKAYASATYDNNKCQSNLDTQKIEKIGAEITLSSPTAGEYVYVGDVITYNIEAKSTCSCSVFMQILDSVSEYLDIEEVYLNDELILQSQDITDVLTYTTGIANKFTQILPTKAGETQRIQIIARVKDTDEDFELKQITNVATIEISGEEQARSPEITHIIRKISENDDNLENIVSGTAWVDVNQNGEMDEGDKKLSGVTVKLFDVSTNKVARDKTGKYAETKTNKDGMYTFSRIDNGRYIVVFEYDIANYELTTYKKEGVSEDKNSNAIMKTILLDGKETTCAVTDTLEIQGNIANINLGLKENATFDLELNKYINRIVVQTAKETKSYECQDSTFQKVEIHRKQINGSTVVVEYVIKVTNTGKIAGKVTNIVDYLPSGMEFSSELNPDWYLSERNLYTKSLANTEIGPGETKEIKLILTKAMTENNMGVINNRAEIIEQYNELGLSDIDSIPNNQSNNEDDIGKADVLISPSTGGRTIAFTLIILLNIVLIIFAILLIFKKRKNKN